MTRSRKLLIAIDGPAGAGKTTVSKMLATRLQYRYLDTGALYRAVAYAMARKGIQKEDTQGVADVCANLTLRFSGDRLLLDNRDISGRIRSPEITMLASDVSALPLVRKTLFNLQRDMGQGGGLVAEGRDMGTVVFPEADLKFFLDASIQQRARRRLDQYGRKDSAQTFEAIEQDIRRRDANDSSRDIAPLRPATDAIIVDSTRLSAQEVVEFMLAHVHRLIRRSAD